MTAPGGRLVQGGHDDRGRLWGEYFRDPLPQEGRRWRIQEPAVQCVVFQDATFPVNPEHQVRQGVERGLQALLGVAQFVLDALALGDVFDQCQVTGTPLRLQANGGDLDVDPDLRAIGAEIAFVHLEVADLSGTQPRGPLLLKRSIVRVCQLLPVERQQFGGGAANDLAQSVVGLDDPAVACIRQDHAQGCLFDNSPEFGLRLRDPCHRDHDAILGGNQFTGALLHLPFQGGVQVTLDDLGRLQGLVPTLDQDGAPTHSKQHDLQQGGQDQADHPDDPGGPGAMPSQIVRRGEDRELPVAVSHRQCRLPGGIPA